MSYLFKTSGDEVFSFNYKTDNVNLIPEMTSLTTPSGRAFSNSYYSGTSGYGVDAFRESGVYYSDSSTAGIHLGYEFNISQKVGKYSITSNGTYFDLSGTPTEWRFEGSNDGSTWDILDMRSGIVWNGTEERFFECENDKNYKMYRLYFIKNNGGGRFILKRFKMFAGFSLFTSLGKSELNKSLFLEYGAKNQSSIDLQQSYKAVRYVNKTYTQLGSGRVFKQGVKAFEIKSLDVSLLIDAYIIVKDDQGYKGFKNGEWIVLNQPPLTDEDFVNGIPSVAVMSISEQKWKELRGDVELAFYKKGADNSISFIVNTSAFTFEDMFQGITLKIVEYTEDLSKNESKITVDSEPFSIYEELGDFVEVLYYTDRAGVANLSLDIAANYSPLDAVNSDFDVVTWVNSSDDKLSKNLEMVALPIHQISIPTTNAYFLGDIVSLLADDNSEYGTGKARYMFSFDGGQSWLGYMAGAWKQIDISSKQSMLTLGMTKAEVGRIRTSIWKNAIKEETRVAYFIEETSMPSSGTVIDFLKYNANANANDVKFSDLAFYMLNTTATINLTFSGNKLNGVLDDADKGKVKYRVSLNGNPYYPANGEFTELRESPSNINIVIDDRIINFGVNNTLKVEFQDYWGLVDSWSSTFIGTHSGLVFSDEQGSFYTTAFGEVLKYLDFGQIIAGQTTFDYKVLMKNNIGYDVENVSLTCVQPQLNGVKIELSKEQNPFIALDELLYPDVLRTGEQVEFAVRIATLVTADETPSGKFEVRVNADRVK